MKIKCSIAWVLALGLVWTTAPTTMAQSNTIDPEFKKYLVYQADRRSMPETLLNLAGLTSQDVGRSFAMIVGVSHYPKMHQQQYRYLAPADRDLDLLISYLKNQQFFDEIVVLRDEAVSFDNLRYFLETYFPGQLKKYPKSRFLFTYSGHGMTEGNSGYFLTSNATSLEDKQHSIDMFALRGFASQTIDAAYQSLFLINACHSGAFLGKSREGAWDVLLNRPGAHAIMSSGTTDSSFGEADKGSFFYQKLIEGLNGAADPRGRGVIIVADLGAYLQTEVGLATGGKQVPTPPQDIWTGVSDGGMFFFNRQKAIKIADLPVWNPKAVLTLGEDHVLEAPLGPAPPEPPKVVQNTSRVTGHVVSKETKQGILGCVVRLRRTGEGVATDEMGDFSFDTKSPLKPGEAVDLQVGRMGYEPVNETITSTEDLKIGLTPSAQYATSPACAQYDHGLRHIYWYYIYALAGHTRGDWFQQSATQWVTCKEEGGGGPHNVVDPHATVNGNEGVIVQGNGPARVFIPDVKPQGLFSPYLWYQPSADDKWSGLGKFCEVDKQNPNGCPTQYWQ